MHFEPTSFYHFYNRGNNKQTIFFSDANYLYFLRKAVGAITPFADILAYCLMPNHFHFLIYTKEWASGQTTQPGNLTIISDSAINPAASEQRGANSRPTTNSPKIQPLTRKIAHLQSSYTRAINKQNRTTGSIFQQKSKNKLLEADYYPLTCFHYIHQNPLKAGLVQHMEDWLYSSFSEYLNVPGKGICNHRLAEELLEINAQSFYEDSMKAIDPDKVRKFYE